VGATGGISGDGNLLTSTNANPTATTGQGAVGLIGQSIGGGGGTDGATGDISVGSGIGVLKAVAGGSSTKGGSGAAVEFTNTGDIATNGNMAAGTVVQSIGGGGGNAILAFGVVTGTPLGIELNAGGSEGVVGNGGTVNLPTFSGMVQTSGALAAGLIAQSIGGGGGYVGFTTPTGTSVGANGVSFDVGGTGGAGGAALSVAFNATQQISTTGVGAAGLLGQSIGGGGGFAGFWSGGSQNPAVSTSILGASGGAGGNGGAVNLGAVGVFTTGTGAIGALAQSIGGGGGIAEAFGVGSSAGLVIGAGAGAHGNGDAVTVTTNIVSTTGNGAHAVVAQSIGGGGGVQMTFNFAGALVTSVVSGGVGGGGGNGGPVNVATNGAIRTTGAGAHGIIAQSVAGGGGIVGGGAFTNTLGLNGPFAGSAGGAGFAGAVTVNAQANVVVTGAASTAIYAQSVNGAGVGGNIGITLGNAVLGTNQFVVGSGDGAATTNAVTFSGGANNTLTSFALLATMAGVNGTAVTGGVGNEAITSFGHMIGSIDLGTGTNSIDNKPYNTNPSLSAGVFDSGVTANLGGPAAGNLLTNEGLLSPGAFLTVMTTNENGNFLQTAPGSCGGFGVPTSTCGYFGVDLDLKSSTADRLNATGTANVSGAVVVNIGNAGDATPGSNTLTVISAAGGETHPNLVVQAQQTAVAQYSLVYPNATDIDLKYSIDFSPAGLTQNQHSVGNAINAIQTAHVQTFRPIAAAIFYQPTVNALGSTYDSLSGEGVAAVEQTAISANDMFHSSILSQARFWMFDNDRNDPNSVNYHDDIRMSYAEARSNGFPNSATPARAVSTPRTWRIWTTVNGGDWRYPADTRIGTASTSASGGGFTSGLDYQFDPTLMAGVAIGYGKAWVRILDRQTNDSVEGTHVASYVAKRFDNAYAIGSLGLDYFTNTESRYAAISGTVLPSLFGTPIMTVPGFAEHLLGTFNSYSVSGMFEAGYKYRFGNYNVTPLAGLNFTSYWMNGFTENNNGAPSFIGLSFASRNVNSVPTFVGAQIDSTQLLANGGSLYGWARATWVHEFLPHRTVNPSFIAAPGFDFVIDGALAPTDLARINLGAKVALNQSVSVSADVRADLYRTPSFAGFAGLKVAW
jgi:uncharacterized protein with beta-barrel porin domain